MSFLAPDRAEGLSNVRCPLQGLGGGGVMAFPQGVALGFGGSPRWGFGIASRMLRKVSK